MTASSGSDRPKLQLRQDRVMWVESDQESVALDLTRSAYLSLNKSATLLWKLLMAGTTQAEMVEALVHELGASATTAEADVENVLDDLIQRELLETQ